MSRLRTRSSALVVVALVLLAGCSGVAAPSTTGGPSGPSGTATSTGGPSGAGAGPVAQPNVTASSNTASSYRALYRRTIDSVVLVRVRTDVSKVTGSGFVYDGSGDIVTNHHVVAGAQSVEVQFHDGTWEQAHVVGSDPYSDLAVLHVPSPPASAKPLPVAHSAPRPGEPVAAIGNPYGLTGSITTGVISGVNRTMPTKHSFSIPATVQTDAAINPGNSGGPLLSRDGTVVGVNRATEGVNIGFAISPAVIRTVVPALIANGSYTHAYLGVKTEQVTPAIANANGLDNARGALVVGTLPGGPANGTLHAASSGSFTTGRHVPTGGDVIVSLNGTPVRTQEDLSRALLLDAHPGERVPVTVLRNGTRTTVHVTLGSRPQP